MSKVFKKIGKIFKKVGKFVMKVAPYALAAAAVVFTGGAALGVLPTFSAAVGGVVSSLGLSTAISGALTGAITSAGFGAAIGGVLGGKKGLKSGFLAGALTGGVMGALNPASFGIVQGASGTTTMNALTHGGNAFAAGPATTSAQFANGVGTSVPLGSTGMAPVPGVPTGAPTTGAPPSASAPALRGAPPPSNFGGVPQQPMTTGTSLSLPGGGGAPSVSGYDFSSIAGGGGGGMAPAAASGGGGFSSLLGNPSVVSGVLQGVGSMLGGDDGQSYEDKAKAEERLARFAYEGAYSGDDPFGIKNVAYSVPKPRYYYDPQTKTVVDRQQQ